MYTGKLLEKEVLKEGQSVMKVVFYQDFHCISQYLTVYEIMYSVCVCVCVFVCVSMCVCVCVV